MLGIERLCNNAKNTNVQLEEKTRNRGRDKRNSKNKSVLPHGPLQKVTAPFGPVHLANSEGVPLYLIETDPHFYRHRGSSRLQNKDIKR